MRIPNQAIKQILDNNFQSGQISEVIFGEHWFELPISIRKDLLFVVMRANKELIMKSGVFYSDLMEFKNVCILI